MRVAFSWNGCQIDSISSDHKDVCTKWRDPMAGPSATRRQWTSLRFSNYQMLWARRCCGLGCETLCCCRPCNRADDSQHGGGRRPGRSHRNNGSRNRPLHRHLAAPQTAFRRGLPAVALHAAGGALPPEAGHPGGAAGPGQGSCARTSGAASQRRDERLYTGGDSLDYLEGLVGFNALVSKLLLSDKRSAYIQVGNAILGSNKHFW